MPPSKTGWPNLNVVIFPPMLRFVLDDPKQCRRFSSDAEGIAAAETWLDGQPSNFFLSGLQKLEQRAKNCIELRGVYVE